MINQNNFTVELYGRTFGVEAAGDYTLPDYQSEIRRVLHVNATVLPPSCYVGNSGVDFNGTVDYQVIYVGGDGGLYSAPLSEEYSFSVPLERGVEQMEDVSALCHVALDGVSARVSAPRRLSLRCRLRPNVRILGKVPPQTLSCDGDDVFKKSESCLGARVESATSEIVMLEYSAPLPTEDTRVVSADATVCVDEKQCSGDGVSCQGRVMLSLLCVCEDSGEMSRMNAEIPFDAEIDMDGCEGDSCARVRGILSEMSVNVGDEGIECQMGIVLEAQVGRNFDIEYVSDVYSCRYECECHMTEIRPVVMLACENTNVTLSERMPLAEANIPEDAQIIAAYCNTVMDKCEALGGKYAYSGNARLSLIWKNQTETSCSDVTFPVKIEMAGDRSAEVSSFDASVTARDIRARVDDGELRVDAELMMSADCMGERGVSLVEQVSFGEEQARRDAAMIVCYPSASDTLWSVAKRYAVSPDDVSGDPATDRYVIIE